MESNRPKNILKEIWGYASFREKQEDIVNAVLEGRDTLALLPTGGGKSVCFQVPALCLEGICLVITPLVALMNDQVDQLKRRGVKALAVHSGMSKRQIDYALDNAVYGDYKFLYLSPERLKTRLFQERLKKMKVSFIAVDEAHCISQWGYDFRPAYLEISKLRNSLPNSPVLALTATATPRVVLDIQEKLAFATPNLIQKSFYRPNLRYFVKISEQKVQTLLAIVRKQQGSGIVYLRSRKQTVTYADLLRKQGIKAEHYHAGLTFEDREKRQKDWQSGKIQVIVCTNAFGMGIDKPDVRFVVNLDLPDSIESYFQEAGRAGRDEKKAFGVLVVDESDKLRLEEKAIGRFPDLDTVKRVYGLVMNSLRIAIGAGEMETYHLNWDKLIETSSVDYKTLTYAAGFIERAGYWQLSDGLKSKAEIMLVGSPSAIYGLQVQYAWMNGILQTLLRSYGGLFETYVEIREDLIAKRANVKKEEVVKCLKYLHQLELADYRPVNKGMEVTMLQPRIDIKYLRIPDEFYHELREVALGNARSMIHYAFETGRCRSVMLLQYFGEKEAEECGVCDSCLERKRNKPITSVSNTEIVEELKAILEEKESLALLSLIDRGENETVRDKIKFAVQWMLDNGIVYVDEKNNFSLKE